jgi:hypothetical protein
MLRGRQDTLQNQSRRGDYASDKITALDMKKQIAHVSILQSSKVVVALYVLMGFIYTLIGIPMIIFGGKGVQIMGIIYCAMPLLMAIFGFIFFVIFAALYNLLARWLGGIEFDVKNIEQV